VEDNGDADRRAGGIKRSRRALVLAPDTRDLALKHSSDVSTLIIDSINQLRRRELDPRVANGMGYLASVLLRSLEQGLMERRVSVLEWSLGMIQSPLTAAIVPSGFEREQEKQRNAIKIAVAALLIYVHSTRAWLTLKDC
jgi:hypothetical protein